MFPATTEIPTQFICRLIDDRLDTKMYEYFIAGDSAGSGSKIFVLFEKYDITIKKVTPAKKNYQPDSLAELITVPLNTNYTSFATIENQLLRNNKPEPGLEDQKQNYFRDFIRSFILDLYINNAFRQCNDVLSIKAALEYVPLMKGIIYKTLYEYYNYFLSRAKLKTEINRYQFEDVYLNYSRFLVNPENERLFLQSGWFAGNINQGEKDDLDAHIYRVEKTFLDYMEKDNRKEKYPNFTMKNPLNIRNILKRYGVLDVLRLTLSKWMAIAFVITVTSLIFFILFDVVHYNYHQPENIEQLTGFWCDFAKYGLFGSIISFSIISLIVLILLTKRFRLKIMPAIFLPRLVIAILSGWVLFLTGEELMKIDLDIDGDVLCLLFFVVTTITLAFMVFEINNYAPAMGWRKIIGRSLLVCSIGFIVSYAFGFWMMSYVTKQFMSIDNYLANKTEIKQKFDNRISYVDTFLMELKDKSTVDEKRSHFKTFSLKKDSVLLADSVSRMKLVEMANAVTNDIAGDINRIIHDFDSLAHNSYISKSGEDLFWKQLSMFPQFRANKTKYYAKSYSGPVGTVTTFPNMLLARAMLALFIGVFFQLIIQDKSITEPI